MADIFISYAREDRTRVRSLADALSAHEWSVWWDREIQAGKAFDQVIADELTRARCVAVVWSHKSTASPSIAQNAGASTPRTSGKTWQIVEATSSDDEERGEEVVVEAPSVSSPNVENVTRIRVAARVRRYFDLRDKRVRWTLVAPFLAGILALSLYLFRTRDDGISQPPPTTVASTESALQLNAVMTGGKPLATGVRYDVYEAVKDVDGKRKRVTNSPADEGPPRFPLPAGRYFVTATSDVAKGSSEVVVSLGEERQLQLRLGRERP
jgi:hypothetical protein